MKDALDKNKLSAVDLLTAPDTDYMNKEQLDFFYHLLIKMETEILANADSTAETLRYQDTVADPLDRATLEEEYSLELRTRDRERKLLYKIREALNLIKDGSYGFCEDTGEPIGIKRLLARPTATLSIEAQERREKMQKHFAEE